MFKIPEELKGCTYEYSEVYVEGYLIKKQYRITYDNGIEVIVCKNKYSITSSSDYIILLEKEHKIQNCELVLNNYSLECSCEEDVINVLKQAKEGKLNEKPNIASKLILNRK